MRRYVNRFEGYTTTYEVWDHYDSRYSSDRNGDIWRRRCIIQPEALPNVSIILPYATELEPELFRQHIIHLISSVKHSDLYYFEHNQSTLRFCTAIGHNEFTPTIDIHIPGYTINRDIRIMPFTFHIDMMNIFNEAREKLPDFLNMLLNTMRY